MSFKKKAVTRLAKKDILRGFTYGEARRWIRECHRHRTRDYGFTKQETEWAISHGFMPEQVKKLGITEDNYRDYISAYDYSYLAPLNGEYNKWITDRITIYNIFKPFREKMPEIYYQISKLWADICVYPIGKDVTGDTLLDVKDFIKEKKEVSFKAANGIEVSTITYEDEKWYLDGNEILQDELLTFMTSFNATVVITERIKTSEIVENGMLNVIVFNDEGDNPVLGDAFFNFDDYEKIKMTEMNPHRKDSLEEYENINTRYSDARMEVVDEKTGEWRGHKLPYWDEIVDTLYSLCKFAPQLEFYGAQVIINEDGFKITDLSNHPEYPTCKPFSKETSAFLMKRTAQKKAAMDNPEAIRARKKDRNFKKRRQWICEHFFTPGLTFFNAYHWPQEMYRDLTTNKATTFGEKMWAYKHGFISYRIPQYGVTAENIDQYLPDYEYRWIRHINGKYRKWMEDKITVKYICSDFNEDFPEYYFHIVTKNGENKVISMMDLPEGYINSYDEIFRLVEEKGVLALKRDQGSHGDGFYKWTFENDQHQLNYKNVTREDVLDILQNTENQYLVTEYIDMCDELKRVYPGSVNTIRMLCFKADNKTPEVHNAYVRIGSKATGAVDNVGAGGMTAIIDIDTGHFHNAKIVKGNTLVDCPIHPDTGVPIDGYIPHWDQVKEEILKVASGMKQLRWLGFDVAVTNEGIKFPEINRSPDYPAVANYAPETIAFLKQMVADKKRAYNFDTKKDTRLFHLPR